MTPTARLIDRLESVRQVAADRWLARCPAHDDKSPSLSIREGDDGRVLIYCFAGCGAVDVVEALGLGLADLFPERLADYSTKRRRHAPPIPAADALSILELEALTVEFCARDLAQGRPVESVLPHLRNASARIAQVRELWRSQP